MQIPKPQFPELLDSLAVRIEAPELSGDRFKLAVQEVTGGEAILQ